MRGASAVAPAPRGAATAATAAVAGTVRAVDALLDQDVSDLADPLGCPLIHQLVGQRRDLLDPPGDLVLAELTGQRRRLRAVLVGVPEHADRVQPRRRQEPPELGDI